ncbi:hypothetical protein CAEBREN_14382 [Caenorhabditis brenneri]|uniref:Uncharacterized protein n=1 Tax=Caenorhabditis brenneri TaxID=135651 RepID=G0PE85_CAEBE|nr:hypothetical protein CAEBREN_14382 [Caenorhabditis brenneri]
MLHHRSLTQY